MKLLIPAAAGLVLLSAAFAQPAAPDPATPVPATTGIRRLELPTETGTYREGTGKELAQAFCLNCHSTEYCESQPALPEKYWDGTIKKMKEKFGAPLPDEAIAPLIKYLTEAYGKKTP